MDEMQILELIKSELSTWTQAQLQVALEFCSGKYRETGNMWWGHLLRTVELEIADRGGADA